MLASKNENEAEGEYDLRARMISEGERGSDSSLRGCVVRDLSSRASIGRGRMVDVDG